MRATYKTKECVYEQEINKVSIFIWNVILLKVRKSKISP
jgi:hypothetical protein